MLTFIEEALDAVLYVGAVNEHTAGGLGSESPGGVEEITGVVGPTGQQPLLQT